MSFMKLCVIPIDNRPVCYNLIRDIVKIDKSIELYIPPRSMLGDLKKTADIMGLYSWLCKLPEVDHIVLSLDTIAYGGLIPSRRSADYFEDIQSRMLDFKEILSLKKAKIHAVSSIMRISNNNNNEEEKEYWSKYGKLIYEYSYSKHQFASRLGLESPVKNLIPANILNDYKQTRNRNFKINQMYLLWQKEGFFETLIFSKDDCAKYGYNVMEAELLKKQGAKVITGADEVPLSLISKVLEGDMSVSVEYTEPESVNLVSNYEDVSIKKSVANQLKLAGVDICTDTDKSDMSLIVNNFKEKQGEIVMGIETEQFSGDYNFPKKPYMVADVRNANGADNNFVEVVLDKINNDNFYGYSGWNTSANSLGSLICCAKMKFLAEKKGTYDDKSFKKVQMTRFLDDWAYQANIRQEIKELCNIQPMMKPYEDKISEVFDLPVKNEYFFPWSRLFEVEVSDELH